MSVNPLDNVARTALLYQGYKDSVAQLAAYKAFKVAKGSLKECVRGPIQPLYTNSLMTSIKSAYGEQVAERINVWTLKWLGTAPLPPPARSAEEKAKFLKSIEGPAAAFAKAHKILSTLEVYKNYKHTKGDYKMNVRLLLLSPQPAYLADELMNQIFVLNASLRQPTLEKIRKWSPK